MEISWLYPIMPHLEQTAVYDEMKESPNPHHSTLTKQLAGVFVCPSDGQNEFDYINPTSQHRTTNYNAVMGPGRDDDYLPDTDSSPYGIAATDGSFACTAQRGLPTSGTAPRIRC